MDSAPHTHTLIVGAGFAGVAMAIRLRAAGDEDWRLVERAETVGGTWRDNAYPGAACDVQSVLYSYSFAPEPGWTRTYAPQAQIQDYLVRVARDRGILRRVETGTALESAQWDDDDQRWHVTTSRGALTADVLVLATGALADPKVPDIDGLTTFAGPVVHTSRWTPAVDAAVAGRRLAVIGTGASAIQVVPGVVDQVAHLDLYQRSAPWVLPRRDKTVPQGLRSAYRRWPGLQRAHRALTRSVREATAPLFVRSSRLGRLAERQADAYRNRSLADPDLRAKATPSYRLGCKRVLISDDYYEALARPTVDLVTDPIVRATPTAVVTRDPRSGQEWEHPTDVIVCATGFLPMRPPVADRLRNSAGTTLAQVWDRAGVQAYKGTTVPGFPNLFFLVGPNTGLGHTSMLIVIEAQVGYVAQAIAHLRTHDLAAIEPTEGATAAWNARLQDRLARSIWLTGGCSSWYLDKHGRNVTLWPGTTWSFERAVARFDPQAYRGIAPSRARRSVSPTQARSNSPR
jgi:cyclohexanone monooxygenase